MYVVIYAILASTHVVLALSYGALAVLHSMHR